MKKCLAVAFLLLLAASPIFSSGEKQPAAKEEAMEGKLTIWGFGNPGLMATDVSKDFEKEYPGVTVEVSNMAPWQMFDKFFVSMMAGQGAPDIAAIVRRILDKYALTGRLVHMDDLIKKHEKSYSPGVLKELYFDGHYHAWPLDLNPSIIIYHKDLMAKSGIDPTGISTFGDLEGAAKKAQSAGLHALWLPKPCGAWGVDHFNMFLMSKNLNIFNSDGSVITNNRGARETLHWWNGLFQYAYTAPVMSPEMWEGYRSEKVVFYLWNAATTSQLKKQAPDLAGKMVFLPWPAWKPGEARQAGQWGGTTWVVPDQSKVQGIAKKWIEFSNTTELGLNRLWEYGNLPANQGIKASSFEKNDEYFSGMNLYKHITDTPFGSFNFRKWLAAAKIIGAEFDLMLLEKQTPDQAWDKIEKRLSSEL